MEELEKLRQQRADKIAEMEKLAAGDMTAEQQGKFDIIDAEVAAIDKKIGRLEKLEARKKEQEKLDAETARLAEAPVLGRRVVNQLAVNADIGGQIKVPARAKRWSGNLQSFKGPDADLHAYKAGMWLAATLCRSRVAQQFCQQHGIATERIEMDRTQLEALHQEGVNTQGGYLVFDEYDTDIIRLVEEFGLARRKMKVVPMLGDTKIRPRRTGGLTAYFVGEGDSGTESTGTWDNVKLITKKLMALTVASNELVSDAIISIADELTREIALAFATKEDLCAFQGDGTSTYGGITGLIQRLSTLNGVDDGGGLVLAAGNLFSEITDANLTKMIGQVPNYPGLQPEWYCSKPFWAQVLVRLIRAAGGATMAEMDGRSRMIYAGYPVNWTSGTSVMPVSDANSQIACLFGDLRMAAMFGDRAGIAIATSDVATVGTRSLFDTDSFAIRGIERFDINVHDVGSATVAGPVVGLITAAS